MDYNQRFIVLDIETTGLNYEYFDEPTEIALIEILNGKLTGVKKHFYLKPYKKITLVFLEKVFGKDLLKKYKSKTLKDALFCINNRLKDNPENEEELLLDKTEIEEKQLEAKTMLEKVNNGKSKYAVLPEVRKFIGDSIVIAHNAVFDVNFLNNYFFSLNLPLIEKYICTFKSYKEHFSFKKNNLTECCKHYNIELNGAHNALEDTEACACLFLKEVEEFPDEILFYNFNKEEAYANFKKKVVKSSYFALTKKVLEEESYVNENIKFTDINLKQKAFELFYGFKKPLEVSKILSIDIYEAQSLFLQWVNCININKHLDLVREKNLSNIAKEILTYTNRDFNKIREINLLMLGTEPNYFVYRLYEKLEFRKAEMNYSLDELDYYFDNSYPLEKLEEKIEKGYDYICDKLVEWIDTDELKYTQYEEFFKDMYNKKSDIGISLKKSINTSKNQYILNKMNN